MQKADERNLRREGSQAEELAERYLTRKGYAMLEKNFRYGRHGEIDLICFDGSTLVFVEVKSRKTARFGTPESAITHRKQQIIRKTAQAFLYYRNLWDRECRFDVIAIELYASPPKIRHLIDAF